MTPDLTTRIAVAIHGATPPDPAAALALHRAQAERVLPVVEAEVARLRAAVEEAVCICGPTLPGHIGPAADPRCLMHGRGEVTQCLRKALATAEDQP